MHRLFYSLLLSSLCAVWSCTSRRSYPEEELLKYHTEIEAWHAHRIEQIKAADGWLNLIGLFWLEAGNNTFGTGEKNQVVFPDSTIEEQAGFFRVHDGRVEMHVNPGTTWHTVRGDSASPVIVFHPDSAKQLQVENGRIAWTIIRRDGKFGVRVRDLTLRGVRSFQGIERYPIDPTYRIEATFTPTAGKTIEITNIIGQTTPQFSPGTLTFSWKEKEYQLDVLEGGNQEYFVIIADETSGKETYAGGRYLYVRHADEQGKTVIDFNKAYNPPCVFTPYATCPLPPRQNVLPFSILAGEKLYGHEVYGTAMRGRSDDFVARARL